MALLDSTDDSTSSSPGTSVQGGGGSSAGQAQYATAQDWDHYQQTITHLYMQENRTLRQVDDMMRQEYGFRATIKMYKTRIRKWNLRKNARHDDRDSKRTQVKPRDEPGLAKSESTLTSIQPSGGGLVLGTAAQRHKKKTARTSIQTKARRRKLADTGGAAAAAAVGHASVGVVARIPSPRPANLKPTVISIPRILEDVDDEVRLPHEIIRLMRITIEGAAHAHSLSWATKPDQDTYPQEVEAFRNGKKAFTACTQWYHKMRLAADMLQNKQKLAEATLLINALLSQLREFLNETIFGSVTALPYLVYGLFTANVEVGLLINNFITQLVTITLGAHHPLSLAWGRLNKLPPQQIRATLATILRSSADFMAGPAGASGAKAVSCLPKQYDTPPETWGMWLLVEDADPATVKPKEVDETFLLSSTGYSIYCNWHIQNENWAAARKALALVETWIAGFGDHKFAAASSMRAWHATAMAALARAGGDEAGEKRHLLEAYWHTVDIHGLQHPETMAPLKSIVRFLERTKATDEAAVWKHAFDDAWYKMLDVECSKLEI
ncbi:hypothetical protein B0T22DRAFT_437284 [Podospora appendiculata]|uniref:Clr5 domain-containing protein n=1 Tax=Podospora appendiculata TaxID=314037 RepID=A0AAE0XIP0_9PEZI|nr:hypothetical protein B0T22DRAFT_437284 [Podospora appendiculata]